RSSPTGSGVSRDADRTIYLGNAPGQPRHVGCIIQGTLPQPQTHHHTRMSTTVAPKDTTAHPHPEGNGHPDDANDRLRHTIEHAAHLLPAQGPITVFIHHNTLHAFEQLPFTEAVKKAARVFGCRPYLTEERYRQELGRGRIRFADLHAVLHEDLGPR